MFPTNNEQLEKFLHENFKTDKEMNEFMFFAQSKEFDLEFISKLECELILDDLNGMYIAENREKEKSNDSNFERI